MGKRKKETKPKKRKAKDNDEKKRLDEIMGALLKVPPKKPSGTKSERA